MIRRLLLSFLAFLLMLGLFAWILPLDQYFPTLFGTGNQVLVLFDEPSPDRQDMDRLDALMLRQLLGHFKNHKIDLVSTGEYVKGQVKEYDIAFYVGTKSDIPIPSYLLDDLYFNKNITVWLGANINKLSERHSLDGFGFRLADAGSEYETNRVQYKGKTLWKLDPSTYAVDIINEENVKVYAWATLEKETTTPGQVPQEPEVKYAGMDAKEDPSYTEVPELPKELNYGLDLPSLPVPKPQKVFSGANARLPWIVQGGNFWFIASNPLSYHIEGGAYLAFCDILHEIYRTKVAEDHPALIRIEDVHAKRDFKGLIEAADRIQSRNLPFHFTLVPAYVNPATGEQRYLSSDAEFLGMVRGLIARGGVPILHGYTHQFDGETAIDYEFWSSPDSDGMPLSTDTEYAASRIVQGLSECYLADIYPISWTTPHYAAGHVDYDAMRSFFTTVLERRQPIDRFGTDQFFPYVIYKDMHNQIIFPESLGYVQPTAGRDPAAILRDADNTLVVRDGWGSFFFHTFLDLNMLEEIIDGLDELGYRFVSLAQYNNKVRTQDAVTITGVGEVDLELNGQYLHEFTIKDRGQIRDETYSIRPITGKVQKYTSTHPGEVSVLHGIYQVPPVTLGNITKFRPFVSGITSPVSLFLLLMGMMIMLTFLVIWIFLLIRKASGEIRQFLSQRR